jgi:hypothetical protein
MAHQSGIGEGYPVCKTSSNFVFGVSHKEPNKVYLQRGYKIYGLTHERTLEGFSYIDDLNIDFHMHKRR